MERWLCARVLCGPFGRQSTCKQVQARNHLVPSTSFFIEHSQSLSTAIGKRFADGGSFSGGDRVLVSGSSREASFNHWVPWWA